jgi:hypothetical protein
MITIYRECPPEVKNMFLQTIVKPEHHSESLLLPTSVIIMVIEVQWACSLLSQILGLDNDKFVVEFMLGFVSTRSHLQIAWKASPIPIKLYVNDRVF